MTHVQYAKVDHLHYLSCNGLLNVFLLVNVSTYYCLKMNLYAFLFYRVSHL